ncbi:hypothetical protein L228DRAFT_125308 [Xylona heveae TC161]|uniref:Uncharacterized protein n=1 Tax=Xylona heveae (strain CBS 132557 / TC161) TaxID=1328760 RepID=A0A165HR09_XYLHT|nr:hypothetical protein L228DRAFT_125308 [Xylona heveae TC161]KZF23853.1 hypothetical protein L228DRAFT_125308 [Xylona heveae TC161]
MPPCHSFPHARPNRQPGFQLATSSAGRRCVPYMFRSMNLVTHGLFTPASASSHPTPPSAKFMDEPGIVPGIVAAATRATCLFRHLSTKDSTLVRFSTRYRSFNLHSQQMSSPVAVALVFRHGHYGAPTGHGERTAICFMIETNIPMRMQRFPRKY